MWGGQRQQGFSLAELMVALLVGLLLILGAGKLYLVGFQSFRDVEALSDKQAAMTFAADVLVRDIRRASGISSPSELDTPGTSLTLEVEGETRSYTLDQGTLELDGEPVVDGFRDDSGAFTIVKKSGALYRITFGLQGKGGGEDIVFHAVNRAMALNGN